MMHGPQILLVEDDVPMAALYSSFLKDSDWQTSHVRSGGEALRALRQQPFDLILLDLTLPDLNGLEVLRQIRADKLDCEVVIATGDCSMSTAIEAMQLGARDYLVKPFNKDRLLTTLSNMVENRRLKQIVETYQEEIDRHAFCGFIGSSLAMQRVYQVIDSSAHSKATVFITGESGTGKEVCAEAIHKRSERASQPFIALNCGAIPKDLIESEIFGHVKGAFTGAVKDRDGAVRAANGGTLFLDEICEMELNLQSKLLRFLQTGCLQKVGSDQLEKVDVRILCATNRNPLSEVENGNFREDLYYRLHVLPISLPPLRERDNDIIEIANSFLKQYSDEEGKAFNGFAPEAELLLSQYDWPGNVRQLQNVVRNIVVLNNGEQVTPDMLPAPLDSGAPTRFSRPAPPPLTATQPMPAAPPSTTSGDPAVAIRPLAELEREAIEQAIQLCDGNIPTAAHYLGISAATIYRKRNAWKNDPA